MSRHATWDWVADVSRLTGDAGIALVAALIVTMVVAALALSLTMVVSTEERVAASYRDGVEAFYAADAAFELAFRDLAASTDWSLVLDGTVPSSFFDGGRVPWPSGPARTAAEATALVRCGRPACSAADLAAVTAERPWGANNPHWQLFASGPVAGLAAVPPDSGAYVAVWVGDDPLETDGNPLVDGDSTAGPNPGQGIVSVLVHAYGPGQARRVIEATVARSPAGVRVLSWREGR